jgi:hypothetical protein
VRSDAIGHVAAPESTSIKMCGLKLQLTWHYVNARPAPYLDLELICGISGIQGAEKYNYSCITPTLMLQITYMKNSVIPFESFTIVFKM